MNPLVTCLCLTKNRRQFLPRAIECFLRQTYEPKELVIVADSEADVTGIPLLEAVDARVALCAAVIGIKRNIGCDLSKGALIAHWDDDDYSAPRRLEAQVEFQRQASRPVTGFRDMRFTDGNAWWSYRGAWSQCFGMSLFYQKAWWADHRFAEIQRGEDQRFVDQALFRQQLATDHNEGLMFAQIHAGNTAGADPKHNPSLIPLPGFIWRDAA